MNRVVEQVRLNIRGEEVVVDRCEDGTFRKPAYLLLEREVVGFQRLTGNACVPTSEKGGTYGVGVGVVPPQNVPVTATAEAKLFDGFGTALKPAWEPFIVGVKLT